MPLYVSEPEFELLPEGIHAAVCSGCVDLGLQHPYLADQKPKRQLLLRFEFPEILYQTDEGDRPRDRWVFYTHSLHAKSNLRRDLERWRGKGFTKEELKRFDVMTIVGAPCEVEVIHDHSTDTAKDRIVAISRFRSDGDKPVPQQPVLQYSDDEKESWEDLPDWIKDKIRSQIKESKPEQNANAPEFKDELPFSAEAA